MSNPIECNPWTRWQSLSPGVVLWVGEVLSLGEDGYSRIRLLGGHQIEARGITVAIGAMAWVQDGVVMGEAPNLPQILIEIP
jgi:hypothetical protein